MALQFPFEGRLLALALSILLFAVSLACPAFYSDGNDSTAGWSAFLLGWIPALFDLLGFLRGHVEDWTCIAWFANPLLLACWILTVRHRRYRALAFGATALALGLVFLATKELPMGDHELKEVVAGGGYRLWMLSIVAALVGAALTVGRKSTGAVRVDEQQSTSSGQ